MAVALTVTAPRNVRRSMIFSSFRVRELTENDAIFMPFGLLFCPMDRTIQRTLTRLSFTDGIEAELADRFKSAKILKFMLDPNNRDRYTSEDDKINPPQNRMT